MKVFGKYCPDFPEVYAENYKQFMEALTVEGVSAELANHLSVIVDGTDYFEAPASTKYHGAFPGGLFKHSFAVAQYLMHFTEAEHLKWERPCSPLLIGLFHDFCKIGAYRIVGTHEDDNSKGPEPIYAHVDGVAGFGGHGADSLCKLLLEIPLTREEALCIRWHMGAYETDKWNEFEAAIKVCPNVLWTHHADMCVSKILGY